MQKTIPEPRLEPKDPPIMGYCAHCGGEIYEGENVTNIGGQPWCSDCFRSDMQPVLETVHGIVSKWLGGRCFK